jgi:hypothetical protein
MGKETPKETEVTIRQYLERMAEICSAGGATDETSYRAGKPAERYRQNAEAGGDL